ncbi:IS5 family transposase [Streptomyces sp. PSKA54]|uniref:IS5 family transposase n=1 Tax=Streptomyces himalayensis subsp. aureolus TaxID=2758039 RepID=A0A7W2D1J1_9ACTN|nr:IS5 family transposase [Streptomyces himalayensis]MBA4862944.1 IS5 family transposase [Streptomyces himalayensis subsp. aureolus]
MPRGHPRGTSDLIHPEKITGERCAGKLARTVREGAVGKGPGPRAPRRRPTSLRRWRDHSLVREFHDRLHDRVRTTLGRDTEPSAGVIDSQSVKADAVVGSDSRGFDGGKLINGRKRHVVVDTLGLLLGVMVTAADTGDRTAAQVLLAQVADAHHRLALVWADGGYTGSLIEFCLTSLALVLAIVKRSDDMRGFVVLPKRWIVERFFAHLMRTRRLARDFERRTTSAEAMVYWSMTLLMTRRLARPRASRA